MKVGNREKAAYALLSGLFLLVISSTSHAYEVRETAAGNAVRWTVTEIPIVLDTSLASLGSQQEVEQVIIEAFDEWVDGADLPFEFSFTRGECGEPGYRQGEDNENCVLARDDYWMSEDDAGATAVVSHGAMSGNIFDADIVFNSSIGTWSTDGTPGTLDFRGAVLHEVGHLLGLKHSEVEEARMAPMLSVDENVGHGLHSDDIDGAYAVYTDWEGDDDLDTVQCNILGAAASGSSSGWLTFTLIALFFWWRRRK